MSVDIFGDNITPIVSINPLVYRKSHKSAIIDTPFSRKYDFKEFISITPTALYLYSRNVAPNTTDYTQEWLNKGATINDDGSINKSGVIKMPRSNEHTGLISRKGNKNIQRCIDWMVTLATDKPMTTQEGYGYTFKLNFITLTLSSKQVHSDAFIKSNILQPFLNFIRKKTWHDADGKPRSMKYYFWRAEAQANGNIHFHLCTDIYIDAKVIQYEWNKFQAKQGYNSIDANKFKKGVAPSTHVRSIHKVKKIAKYLSKYCGKNSKGIQLPAYSKMLKIPKQKLIFAVNKKLLPNSQTKFFRPIYGKLWSCSENLSRLKKHSAIISDDLYLEISKYRINNPKKCFQKEFCTIIDIDITQLLKHNMPHLRSLLLRHVLNSLNPPLNI